MPACQSSVDDTEVCCRQRYPKTGEEGWSGSRHTLHGKLEQEAALPYSTVQQECLEGVCNTQQRHDGENVARIEHFHDDREVKFEEYYSNDSGQDICWICHEDGSRYSLEKICSCSWLRVHRNCLARWQLQQAGKIEEKKCRFCGEVLPDWREAHGHLPKAQPVMTVVHDNVMHQVVVEPGEYGQRKFQEDIRRIFGLQDDDAIQLTFGCRIPECGQEVTLEGWDSYDAAVHCASLSAGQREKRQQSASPPKRTICQRRKISSSSPQGVLRRLFTSGGNSHGPPQEAVQGKDVP